LPKRRKVIGFYTDDQKRIRPLTYYFEKYGTIEERREELKRKVDEQEPVFPMAPDPRKLPPAPARLYSEGLLKALRREPGIIPNVDNIKLLPEYEKYVEENYPPLSWDPEERIYFKVTRERSRILGEIPAIVAYYSKSNDRFLAEPGVIDGTTFLTRNEKQIGDAIKKLIERNFGTELKYPIRVRREHRNGEEVYFYDELVPAQMLFMRHVEQGLIKDKKGRILSPTEVQGLPPEGGFLNRMDQMLLGTSKDWRENIPYYPGLVVKICGDYRQDLREDHNTWAVITKILDPYRYEVMQEGSGKKLILRDTDVKGIIGDYEHDFIGIGKERHEQEVKPLIEKALRKYAEDSQR